jgi:Transposase DDE domain
MLLGPIFERFVAGSPLSVMARATIEQALSPSALDDLFERTRDKQYTRELLFSSVVDLMSLVVCGIRPHVKAAFQDQQERIPVTLKCVYEKLQNLETPTSAELVRFTARRCEPLIRELQGTRPDWLPGYRITIVDGNHLSGTEHRLLETRGSTAAPLPGLSLVVLGPALMMAIDVLPCEDGHAQERSLLGDLLGHFEAGDVCVADRNFCTTDFLSGLVGRGAFPVIRRHANLTLAPKGPWGAEVETETGWVSERPVGVMHDGVQVLPLRCIRVRLKKPTREGETEIEILTNLPAEDADAVTVAALYLGRWTVEGMFQDLTQNLGCEVNTLCYPKAALFGFCVALVAYNILAVTKAALRAVHGEKKIEEEVPGYYLALEWEAVYTGMMIAIPAEEWVCFQEMGVPELASILRELASRVKLAKFKKSPRPPKKAPPKRRNNRKQPHVSTARILEARKRAKGKNR